MNKERITLKKQPQEEVTIGVFVGQPYKQFVLGLLKFVPDFIRGRRYGYPTCCVLYYCILGMTELPAGASKEVFEYEENDKNYAQCPRCLIKNMV